MQLAALYHKVLDLYDKTPPRMQLAMRLSKNWFMLVLLHRNPYYWVLIIIKRFTDLEERNLSFDFQRPRSILMVLRFNIYDQSTYTLPVDLNTNGGSRQLKASSKLGCQYLLCCTHVTPVLMGAVTAIERPWFFPRSCWVQSSLLMYKRSRLCGVSTIGRTHCG